MKIKILIIFISPVKGKCLYFPPNEMNVNKSSRYENKIVVKASYLFDL